MTTPQHDLVGACLLDPAAYRTAVRCGAGADLFTGFDLQVWRAMDAATKAGQHDIHTIRDELRKQGVKDMTLLSDMISATRSTANVEYLARICQQDWLKNRLRTWAATMADPLFDPIEALDQVERIRQEAAGRLTSEHTTADHIGEFVEEMEARIKDPRAVRGVAFGLDPFDRVTRGWQPGRLYVLAARPGQGKTDFACFAAYNAARAGQRVCFISLEMTGRELIERMAGLHAPTDKQSLATAANECGDMGNVVQWAAELGKLPLDIADVNGAGIDDICIRIADAASKGAALIIVDYLGLIRHNYRENNVIGLGEISRKLKQASKLHRVPILALHQMNRAGDNERPRLVHLRGSGEIEQDADVVAFLYRLAPDNVSEIEICVEKNRHSPGPADIPCTYNPATGQFTRRDAFTIQPGFRAVQAPF